MKERPLQKDPLIVSPPVHGTWYVWRSPASKTRKHPELFGQGFAVDLVKAQAVYPTIDLPRFCVHSQLRSLLCSIPASDCHGWGEVVYAPLSGKVVFVQSGVSDCDTVRLLIPRNVRTTYHYKEQYGKLVARDRGRSRIFDLSNAKESNRAFYELAGNCVILNTDTGAYCILAHLAKGSITVEVDQTVSRGETIAKVGNSGNSTFPHLHMQLCNSLDFISSQAIPFFFDRFRLRGAVPDEERTRDMPSSDCAVDFG